MVYQLSLAISLRQIGLALFLIVLWSISRTFNSALQLSSTVSQPRQPNNGEVAATTPGTPPLFDPELWVDRHGDNMIEATTPVQWSHWLKIKRPVIVNISNIQEASVFAGGCGVSAKLSFQQNRNATNQNHATTTAFFKAQVNEDISHYDAESHFREIAASYLDQILQTHVVPPCVGFRLDRTTLRRLKNKRRIEQKKAKHNPRMVFVHAGCAVHYKAPDPYLDGSLMMWTPELYAVDGEEIVDKARMHNASRPLTDPHFSIAADSAVRYAIFHYIGACMKSQHNHFAHDMAFNETAPHSEERHKAVAIDNDRCFTPRNVYSGPEVPKLHQRRITLWSNLVLKELPCEAFPMDVMEAIVHEPYHVTRPTSFAHRLLEAIRGDVLGPELLSFFPTQVFWEMDRRLETLASRWKRDCQPHNGKGE